jgi:hypothetical protein
MKIRALLALALLVATCTLPLGSVTQAAAAMNCAPAQLRVTFGAFQGTAGTFVYPLFITNEGAACAISTYPPTLQPVRGTRHVGAPTFNGVHNYIPVINFLAHHQRLSTLVGFTDTGNYSPATCKPTAITGVLVSFTGVTNRFVPLAKITVCTAVQSVHVQSISLVPLVAPTCAASQLAVSFGQFQGTAGTFVYPLIITNRGATCTIVTRRPILQPVNQGVKEGSSTANGVADDTATRYQLKHLQSLSSLVGFADTGNYSSATCKPRAISAVLVSFANVISRYVPLAKLTVCTALQSVHVQKIAAGTQNQ